MPLTEPEPPSVRPCVVAMARPAVQSVGTVVKGQVMSVLNSVLTKPAGMWMKGLLSTGPASSTHTVAPVALRRLAMTEAAVPPPTIT